MHIGFSGSRHGPCGTDQRYAVERALKELRDACVAFPHECRFHHGDCMGWDALAHDLAYHLGWPITIHPPTKAALRAFCGDDDPTIEILPKKPYLQRNSDIVDACAVLIVAPNTHAPPDPPGGTWYTYRRARTVGRRVILILPNGQRAA